MAVRSLRFVLTGEDKSATKALDKVGRKAEGLGSKLGKLSALSGAALGAGAVVFAKDSIRAYADAEEAQKRLAFAFAKFPKLADTNQGALQKLNTSLQKKTKYDDDAIASGQAVLAQFELTGKQIEKVTPLLLDYADTTGKELPDAAQDLGKALLGNAKALKNVGIKYKATGDAGKDFTNIQALLNKKVGGFAENEGKTAAGQVQILKNQFGELQETVGSQLLPVVTSFVKWLTDKGVPALQSFADEFKAGKGAGGELRDMLGEVKDAASTAADVANKTIVPVIRWFSQHPDALKGVVEGMVAFKVATMGAAIWSKSLAFWAPKAAAGEVLMGTGAAGAAAEIGAAGGASGLVGALAGLSAIDIAAWGAAAYGVFERISAVVKGLNGDIGPLTRLTEFGVGPQNKGKMTDAEVQKYVAGLPPAKQQQFYSWYPQYRPAAAGPAVNPRLSPTRSPDGPVRHRARGGNIEAGLRYMIGENGPEWFTPRQSGYVTPHGMGINPRARLDTSQIVDRRRSADRLLLTPAGGGYQRALAPAGMRDYISYHTTVSLDGKKVGTANTRRTNARVSRGHLPPGVI